MPATGWVASTRCSSPREETRVVVNDVGSGVDGRGTSDTSCGTWPDRVDAVATFPAGEVEDAFRHLWRTGPVGEDWNAQANLYTPDCSYVDCHYGVMGREEFRAWCTTLMTEQFPELYTVYQWHVVDGDEVVALMQNRRDNPAPAGPAYLDFSGVSIFRYAGDGRWSGERDYWSMEQAVQAGRRYREACARHDPGHPARRSRLHWPAGPEWARPDDD